MNNSTWYIVNPYQSVKIAGAKTKKDAIKLGKKMGVSGHLHEQLSQENRRKTGKFSISHIEKF